MDTAEIKEKVQPLLDKIKKDDFLRPNQVSDSEAMGILVSKYFGWTITDVLETCYNAMEDSNLHDECAIVQEMLEKYK